jgi:hypothetical protein
MVKTTIQPTRTDKTATPEMTTADTERTSKTITSFTYACAPMRSKVESFSRENRIIMIIIVKPNGM